MGRVVIFRAPNITEFFSILALPKAVCNVFFSGHLELCQGIWNCGVRVGRSFRCAVLELTTFLPFRPYFLGNTRDLEAKEHAQGNSHFYISVAIQI